MARARNMPDGVGVRWIWDLNFAVGPACANRTDDVQLVQHAINTLSAAYSLTTAEGRMVGYLKRDGIFGPKTRAAVLAYQNARKAAGKLIKPDGRVDPSSATGWTADSNAQFVIVYLNRDHRDVWGKMMDENDFPEPLRTNVRNARTVEG